MRFFFLLLLPVLSYVPFCINCKHYKKSSLDSRFGKCALFPMTIKDNYYVVNGIDKYKDDYYFCSNARGSPRMCGVNGTFYETKMS
jgi:hypothetical protein